MTSTAAATQADVDAYYARLLTDFDFYLQELWEDRGLGKVAPLGRVERDIASFGEGGPRLRQILAFRQVGKTHLVTASLACYRLLQDPNHKVIVVSKTDDFAKKAATLIRGWIEEVWFLRHLVPESDQRDNLQQFDVSGAAKHIQPSLTAIGITGQLEGNRAHTIIGDDVETDTNTDTPTAREKLADRINEFLAVVYSAEMGGKSEVVLVGTPHHEETLYFRNAEAGYETRTWPMAYPGDTDGTRYLAPMLRQDLDEGKAKAGDPVCPHRFGPQEIAFKMSGGRRHWQMQYMLAASLGDTDQYPLRLADLIVTEFGATSAPYEIEWATRIGNTDADHPDIPMLGFSGDRLYRPMTPSGGSKWGDFLTTIAFIDVAGRGKDELGLGIGSSLGGRVYIHRVDGYIDGIAYETLASIARTLRNHRVREVFVETNFGGEMFPTIFGPVLREHFLRPGESDEHPDDDGAGWACAITPTRATGRKEERIIDTLEPVMASHRLVVHPRALDPDHPADAGQGTEYTLQHQLTRLTRIKGCLRHDDRIDTLAGVVGKFQDYLHIDTRSATEKLRQRELEDAMAEMRTMGRRREVNWMPHRR